MQVAALQIDVSVTAMLALQALGATAGNMVRSLTAPGTARQNVQRSNVVLLLTYALSM